MDITTRVADLEVMTGRPRHIATAMSIFAGASGLSLLMVAADIWGEGDQRNLVAGIVFGWSFLSMVILQLYLYFRLGTTARKRPLALIGIIATVGGTAAIASLLGWVFFSGRPGQATLSIFMVCFVALLFGLCSLGIEFWRRGMIWRRFGIANPVLSGVYIVFLFLTVEGIRISPALGSTPLALYLSLVGWAPYLLPLGRETESGEGISQSHVPVGLTILSIVNVCFGTFLLMLVVMPYWVSEYSRLLDHISLGSYHFLSPVLTAIALFVSGIGILEQRYWSGYVAGLAFSILAVINLLAYGAISGFTGSDFPSFIYPVVLFSALFFAYRPHFVRRQITGSDLVGTVQESEELEVYDAAAATRRQNQGMASGQFKLWLRYIGENRPELLENEEESTLYFEYFLKGYAPDTGLRHPTDEEPTDRPS